MNDIIIIKDLIFKYNDNIVFNHFNLEIKENTWISIVGPNGSGKSTLMKILIGLLKAEGYINIDKELLIDSNIKNIRTKIGVVFENPDNCFVAETVMDEIAFSLENLNYSKKEIKKRIEEISNYLNITNLLQSNPHRLSGGEKQLVALASALIIRPKILFLDEAFNRMDSKNKGKILISLKELQEKEKMTVINITHDMEETIYGDKIIVIDNGKIILNGSKELVFKEEKVFNQLGLEIPFIVSLSLKLQYYNLINDIIFDIDEMVNRIWK